MEQNITQKILKQYATQFNQIVGGAKIVALYILLNQEAKKKKKKEVGMS